MAIVLALISAAAWGISDFFGGTISKRQGPWVTAVAVQLSALIVTAFAVAVRGGSPTVEDWAWGAAAGVGVGVGTAFLFRGLAAGRMGIVAPISAIGAAVVPVAVGLGLGERPGRYAAIGIAAALPAIWLIARSSDLAGEQPSGSGIPDAVLAGLGFGFGFVCIDRISDGADLAPFLATQVAALLPVLLVARTMGEAFWPRSRSAWAGALIGPLGAGANACALWAMQAGMLSIVSVVISLYPATTVALAALVLRERIHAQQYVGLALAAAAVALISLP
ncbi:MAG TPA: DMT family transporter [Aeromicrobium sp.]|nr:DMT family transporter [Aeromicrobium sp.]